MLEQRGHGEPVGQRTHHAGLGGRSDVPDPPRGTLGLRPRRHQEDDGRAEQEADGDDLHPAQSAPTLGVSRRVDACNRFCEARPLAGRGHHTTIILHVARGSSVPSRQPANSAVSSTPDEGME
jgi:hypothetical protein